MDYHQKLGNIITSRTASYEQMEQANIGLRQSVLMVPDTFNVNYFNVPKSWFNHIEHQRTTKIGIRLWMFGNPKHPKGLPHIDHSHLLFALHAMYPTMDNFVYFYKAPLRNKTKTKKNNIETINIIEVFNKERARMLFSPREYVQYYEQYCALHKIQMHKLDNRFATAFAQKYDVPIVLNKPQTNIRTEPPFYNDYMRVLDFWLDNYEQWAVFIKGVWKHIRDNMHLLPNLTARPHVVHSLPIFALINLEDNFNFDLYIQMLVEWLSTSTISAKE